MILDTTGGWQLFHMWNHQKKKKRLITIGSRPSLSAIIGYHRMNEKRDEKLEQKSLVLFDHAE